MKKRWLQHIKNHRNFLHKETFFDFFHSKTLEISSAKNFIFYFSILICLIIFIFFFDIIFLGRTLSSTSYGNTTLSKGPFLCPHENINKTHLVDTTAPNVIEIPATYINEKSLKKGIFPLWNPYNACGEPWAFNTQTSLFSPLNLFINLFPSLLRLDIFWIIRVFIAALCMGLYLNLLGLRNISAFVGGIIYAFSGHIIYCISQFHLNHTILTPLILYSTERVIRKDSRKDYLLLIIVSVIYFLGGNPQPIILDMGMILFYIIFRLLFFPGFRKKRKFFIIITCYIFGFLICMPVYLPFVEIFKISTNFHPPAFTDSYHLSELLHIFAPFKAGEPPLSEGKGLYYVGTISLILAFFGLIISGSTKRKFSFFFAFLLFGFFTITFKVFLPSKVLMKYPIPILSQIAYLKYNHLVYISLSIMAAFGLNRLIERKNFSLGICFISLLVLAIFVLLKLLPSPNTPEPCFGWPFVWVGILSSLILILKRRPALLFTSIFLMVVAELFIYSPSYHPKRCEPYKPPPFIKFLKEKEKENGPFRVFGFGGLLTPYSNAVFSICDIRTVSPFILNRYYKFWKRFIPYHPVPSPFFLNSDSLSTILTKYIDLLGCKYIVTEKDIYNLYFKEYLKGNSFKKESFDLFMNSLITGYTPSNVKKITKESILVSLPFHVEGRLKISRRIRLNIYISGINEPSNISLFLAGKKINTKKEKEGISLYVILEPNILGKNISFSLKIEGKKGQKCWIYPKLISFLKPISDYKKIFFDKQCNVYIYENKNSLPLAFVVKDVIWTKNDEQAFDKLVYVKNFQKRVFIEGKEEFSLNLKGIPKDEKAKDRIRFIKREPNIIKIRAKIGERSLFVLTDTFYPGWKAYLNGKRVKIYHVDGLFKGIYIPEKGNYIIEFRYLPTIFIKGILISIFSFVAAFLFCFYQKG